MLITYRRTGGGLFVLAAVLVATGITVALTVVMVTIAATIGAAVLLVRAALLPSSQRRQTAPQTPWPGETIEATVVNPHSARNEGHLLHLDIGKG